MAESSNAMRDDEVRINREAWSSSSRRSLGNYDQNALRYESIRCKCRGCGLSFVCSAAEQRDAYEVQKKHINWLPSRCPTCASQLAALRKRDRDMQARWDLSRPSLSADLEFLQEWLKIVQSMRTLGVKSSMEIHLKKMMLLTQPSPADPATIPDRRLPAPNRTKRPGG